MKLNVKRKILGYSLIVMLLSFAILGFRFHNNETAELIIMISYAVLLIAYTVLFAVWWRCPHCGKHLGASIRNINYCPYCAKELDELYDE